MNKISRLYILFPILIAVAGFVFADEPASNPSSVPGVSTTSSDDQASYFNDLKKLIEKSSENITRVNEKNKEQEILKRNQKSEEQARDYYEIAVELTNEGKLDEAREYFEKAIRNIEDPQMAGYMQEANRVNSDYQATMNYVRSFDQDSQEKLERVVKEKLKIKERERNQQFEEQVQFNYKAAIVLFNNKAMDKALEKFNDIEKKYPGFKSTTAYIARIKHWQFEQQQRRQEEQRRQQQQASRLLQLEVNRIYISALDHYRARDFKAAQEELLKVNKIIPDYKSTQNYLSKIEDKINQAQSLYQAAIVLFDNKVIGKALEKFNDIEEIYPDFKSTRDYIVNIKQWQSDQQRIEVQKYQRQKKLMEELDRQERLYENEGLLQRQKQETMKKAQQTSVFKEQVRSPAAVEEIKPVQIVGEEGKRRAELLRQEYKRQAQLNARREVIRKQLEDGVEVMYQEAVHSYKQGQYAAAADKFKDIQDILPSYKRTSQYMDEAHLKAQTAVMPPAQSIPETSIITDTSNPPSVLSPATHQDVVSKALDLFDPNVK